MKRVICSEKKWAFARKVLLEIKKQQTSKADEYPDDNELAYNVALLLDKQKPIPIQELGKY